MFRVRELVLVFALIALAGVLALSQVEKVYIAVEVVPQAGGVVQGDGLYEVGATVSLEAIPNPGYRFKCWQENEETISSSPILEFVAEKDRELTAVFEPLPPEVKGRLDFDLQVLPSLEFTGGLFETTAKVYNLFPDPVTITTRASYTSSGWTGFSSRVAGRFGESSWNAGIDFDPPGLAYRSAYFGVWGRIGGLRWNLRGKHSAFGGVPPGPYLLYTLNLSTSELSLTIRAEDGSGGVQFRDLVARSRSLPFSGLIGLEGTSSLAFTKDEGFSYFSVDLQDVLSFCCGVGLDLKVKFTLQKKEITLLPRWWPGVRGGLSVFGNPIWVDGHALKGFEIYGYKLRCCFDCNICPGARISGRYVELGMDTRREEDEYWKLGTCGPACCGGFYTIEGAMYFRRDIASLFSLSRIVLKATFPLAPAAELQLESELPIGAGALRLVVGGKLKF